MRRVRYGLLALVLALFPAPLLAAPFAAYVMDARTGEVLYEKNAQTRLHPASLTKMMTLYIAFQAIERGEVSLDTLVTVSANAAAQPPSRLGLRAGQKIELRYLLRAAAIKSANDAASAIGDHLGGSEAKFAARMNRTAQALGMTKTSFKNANGLTREGHLSTARDMSILGRHLLYDFPQYYNLFSRRSADAGVAQVANTNRRFLDGYAGADGIKTGYTAAAGFNLVASAQRGNKRVIATVFGGTTTASRNAKVAELLDLGFARAPGKVTPQKPEPPMLIAEAETEIAGPQVQGAVAEEEEGAEAVAEIKLAAAGRTPLARSPRPQPKPALQAPEAQVDAEALALAVAAALPAPQSAPTPVTAKPAAKPAAAEAPVALAALEPPAAAPAATPATSPAKPAAKPAPAEPATELAAAQGARFLQAAAPQPETLAMIAEAGATLEAQGDTDPGDMPLTLAAAPGPVFVQTATAQPETLAMAAAPQASRNDTVILAALSPPAPAPQGKREVVARASSSGGRNWGISLGKYPSQYAAEQVLLKTALMESDTLSDSLRKVANRKNGFEALFVGLTEADAALACARLSARAMGCTQFGP